MSEKKGFIPYEARILSEEDSLRKAAEQYKLANERRSVRDFSDKPVPFKIIHDIVMTAGTAPSGAHKQPWTFSIVGDQNIKSEIRKAAEKEEYDSYNRRMSEKWLQDLAPIGTDWNKPFLEIAPWLIIVFKRPFEYVDGEKWQNYYVNESVGIACGMLINAIHNAGLITLTHTPSPMNFLSKILKRPDNERPFLLLPVGYPADEAMVPNLKRKSFEEITDLHV